MKKIAIFCALPSERNTGMATVDLAAYSVIRRLVPEAEITLYAYGKVNIYTYQPGELPYHYLDVTEHGERYLASDIFIFWGDFIHSRSYWVIDRGLRNEATHNLSQAELDKWLQEQFGIYSKYIFLTSLPQARLKDVIVFGSTIITNEAQDQADALYYENFKRFFENAGAVYFRDALSAAKISPFRGSEASLGCDCVFLLKDSDLQQISGFRPANERKGVGVFFGRSSSKLRMILFARLAGRHLGEKCSWMPWFAYPLWQRKHRWPLALLGFWVKAGDTDTGVVLSALSGYKYIITDTYHLCINAWRMGIPAICIGQGTGRSTNSLSDKKKEILYEMYGARQFYVFIEAVRSLRSFFSEAKRAGGVLANKGLVTAVSQNITQHHDMALQRLGNVLRTLLDKE